MGKPSQRESGPRDGLTSDALKKRKYAVAEVTWSNAREAEGPQSTVAQKDDPTTDEGILCGVFKFGLNVAVS